MTFLLLRAADKRHHQTFRMVTRIIQLTVETNTVSSILAILTLALYSVRPLSILMFYFAVPKISFQCGKSVTYFLCPYANSLLISFNNRAYVLKEAETVVPNQSSNGGSAIRFTAGLTFHSGTNNCIQPKMSYAEVLPEEDVKV
ncbi:hypothetical protein GYMLUDRAFT_64306 [Collybiopsis luxurians FD-317 M1]|uniref:DUF6534 domain-containing protein n=1 Tax=Collybiopsis luxurians FD-317 M1 TaxID=944289 RepID=A0A0D0C3H6_9AGAR|nr:hypothetical protein GYMLUDRAFT_64306 [Collybiopsis luxurians FD-317 M1]